VPGRTLVCVARAFAGVARAFAGVARASAGVARTPAGVARTPAGVAVAAACIALAAPALLFAFDPATTWWFPSCPFRALTGWLCPFCGSLRALHALLRGAPRLALALNPLASAGLVLGAIALVHDAVRPGRATRFQRLTDLCFSGRGLALVVAFGVFRNLLDPLGWIVR
jgi:hypothetical protein